MEINKKKEKIFNILAVICIVLFCASISPKVLQNDTYYTIKIGEYIYNNGISDLTQDVFSWHNLPYTYPHWLYDLGMYIIYNIGGQLGIYISTMVFASILGICVYALGTEKSNNRILAFIFSIGAMYLMKSFIAARAQLVTFILFVLTVLFIEKFLRTHKKRYAVFLVIIPLLIANLHCAVFPFYFVLFLPYLGEYLLAVVVDWDLDKRLILIFQKIRRKLLENKKSKDVEKLEKSKEKLTEKIEKTKFDISERKRKRTILRENPYKIKIVKSKFTLWLVVIMILAFATGIINPAGDGAYTYLYKTLQGNTTSSINEHLPIVLAENSEFLITLVMFLAILIFSDTKIRLCDLFMLCGLTYLTLKSRRQESMFAIFCGPILVKLIADMFAKYDRETYKKVLMFATGWFGSIVIICIFALISIKQIKPKLSEEYVNSTTYPVEASNWILSELDVSNIKLYNEYNYGSYLLFRGIPVFIDSRCDLYSPEFNGDEKNGVEGRDIFSDALNIAAISVNYNEKFEEYGVTHIITYSNAKLAMLLEDDSGYKRLYSDGKFKIFERIISSDTEEDETTEEISNTDTISEDAVIENVNTNETE